MDRLALKLYNPCFQRYFEDTTAGAQRNHSQHHEHTLEYLPRLGSMRNSTRIACIVKLYFL